ncbi:hypothetical protein TrLO_g10594 [Triparma laevis f. longispina]|uniref:Uncharacterized protein n=1 Tax=Triparma laevis f. longispina TaxID=1714387 RepID=A0A9W7ECY8_9STRA|nr:hypothetical protein TrLO_g10594 [Triparma laevis f. longispina]
MLHKTLSTLLAPILPNLPPPLSINLLRGVIKYGSSNFNSLYILPKIFDLDYIVIERSEFWRGEVKGGRRGEGDTVGLEGVEVEGRWGGEVGENKVRYWRETLKFIKRAKAASTKPQNQTLKLYSPSLKLHLPHSTTLVITATSCTITDVKDVVTGVIYGFKIEVLITSGAISQGYKTLLEIDKVQIIVDEENRVDVSMDGFRINLNLKVVDVLYEIFGQFRGVHERQSSWACGLKGWDLLRNLIRNPNTPPSNVFSLFKSFCSNKDLEEIIPKIPTPILRHWHQILLRLPSSIVKGFTKTRNMNMNALLPPKPIHRFTINPSKCVIKYETYLVSFSFLVDDETNTLKIENVEGGDSHGVPCFEIDEITLNSTTLTPTITTTGLRVELTRPLTSTLNALKCIFTSPTLSSLFHPPSPASITFRNVMCEINNLRLSVLSYRPSFMSLSCVEGMWRNKRIWKSFDVREGEVDLVEFRNGYLDGFDDFRRDLTDAKVAIAEINGTTNRQIHIQKILFPFAGLNSTENTPYTITVTSFTFKSLSLPTCDKFFVSFALRVLSKSSYFGFDHLQVTHTERISNDKKVEATAIAFNDVEAEFQDQDAAAGLLDFLHFVRVAGEALEELQRKQHKPDVLVNKSFRLVVHSLKLKSSPLLLSSKVTFVKNEHTSSNTTIASNARLLLQNLAGGVEGAATTFVNVSEVDIERGRQVVMPELIPLNSDYTVKSPQVLAKMAASSISSLSEMLSNLGDVVRVGLEGSEKSKAGLRSLKCNIDLALLEINENAASITMTAEHTACKMEGSIRDSRGEITSTATVKYLNPIFQSYEDCLEPFPLTLTLEKDHDGTSVEFAGTTPLLVNVTSANVATVGELVSAWEKGGEGNIDVRSFKTEVTWKNPNDVVVEVVNTTHFRVISPEGYALTTLPLPSRGSTSAFHLDPVTPSQTLRIETFVEIDSTQDSQIEGSKENWTLCDSEWIVEELEDGSSTRLTRTFAQTRPHYESLHSKFLAFPAPTSKKASIAQTLHHHEGALWYKIGGAGAQQSDFQFPLKFAVTNLGDGEVRSSGALSIANGTNSFLTFYVYSIGDDQNSQPTQSYDIEPGAGLFVPAKVASEAMAASFGSVVFSVLSPGACGGTRKFATPYLNDVGKEREAEVTLEFGNEGVKLLVRDKAENDKPPAKRHHRRLSSTQSTIYENLLKHSAPLYLSPPLPPSQYSITISLSALQISFCSNLVKPYREVALLSLVGVTLSSKEGIAEVKIIGIQLDNFEPKAPHGVALTCGSVRTPFLQFKYCADEHRISELTIIFANRLRAALDATSTLAIVAFVEDTLREWNGSWDDETAETNGEYEWFSRDVKIDRLKVGDVCCLLTWSAEGGDGEEGEPDCPEWLKALLQSASFPNAQLSMQGLELLDISLPLASISERVGVHYSDQVTYQLFSIISSFSVLGAPAEMVSNVGSGVGRFLIKPIKGVLEGDVMEGVEEGVQGLMGGVIGGMAKSLGRVGEVLNQKIAFMTDSDYIETRDLQNRQNGRFTPEECDGVEVLARKFGAGVSLGFVSGTRGLINLVENGNVTGTKVARAMVGAIVKPIVGINDGIITTLQSISDADLLRPPALQVRGENMSCGGSAENKMCSMMIYPIPVDPSVQNESHVQT